MALVTPTSISELRRSIGVVTNLHWTDTPYNDWVRVVGILNNIGIMRVRDVAGTGHEWIYERIKYGGDRGLRYIFGIGSTPLDNTATAATINWIGTRLKQWAVGVEMPNEYDISGDANWVVNLRNHMKFAYPKVRATSGLNGVPVVGPTLVNNGSAELLRDSFALSATNPINYIDRGNIHPYTGGANPSQAHMVSERIKYAPMFGLKPFFVSECGFHNAVNNPGQPFKPVPESVSGVYALTTFLTHWKAGIKLTTMFTFINNYPGTGYLTDKEQSFGLIRNNYSLKPAAVNLKAFLAMLGPDSFYPVMSTPLEYTSSHADIHHILLRRTDGTYLIVLWRDEPIFDRNTQTPIAVSTAVTNVHIPDAIKVENAYPTGRTSWQPSALINKVAIVGVAGIPVVLRVTVTGAGAGP